MSLHRGQRVVIYSVAIIAGIIGAFFLPLPGRYSNSSQSATPSPKLTGPVAACTNNNVRAGLDPANTATGHLYYYLIFVNTNDSTCTLSGYPKLVLADANNQPLGSPAIDSPVSHNQVTLNGGDVAHAFIDFPIAANQPAGACSAAATNLLVYLPGQTVPLTVVSTQHACAGWSVQPFASGASQ